MLEYGYDPIKTHKPSQERIKPGARLRFAETGDGSLSPSCLPGGSESKIPVIHLRDHAVPDLIDFSP